MSTDIQFVSIPDFPNYEVHPHGRVRPVSVNPAHPGATELSPRVVTGGAYAVTLYRDGKPFTRGVKRLVADAFVPVPESQGPNDFDTVIQLDNNPANCDFQNLRWRPRWFAVQYKLQWDNVPEHYLMPVHNLVNGMVFGSMVDAAMTNGELLVDVYNSAGELRPIFPDGNMYGFIRA